MRWKVCWGWPMYPSREGAHRCGRVLAWHIVTRPAEYGNLACWKGGPGRDPEPPVVLERYRRLHVVLRVNSLPIVPRRSLRRSLGDPRTDLFGGMPSR